MVTGYAWALWGIDEAKDIKGDYQTAGRTGNGAEFKGDDPAQMSMGRAVATLGWATAIDGAKAD